MPDMPEPDGSPTTNAPEKRSEAVEPADLIPGRGLGVVRNSEMTPRTTHEMRTQKMELQAGTPQGKWVSQGYFRTVGAARNAAGKVKGIRYRIVGDEEVKESWQS